MGFKRTVHEEEYQECPFKRARQLEPGHKLTSLAESFYCFAPEKDEVQDLFSKAFEMSAPFSWIDSRHSERDVGSETALSYSLYPENFDSEFPWKSQDLYEDTHIASLDCSHRKRVPLGPNYQADVPVWAPQVTKKYSSFSDHSDGGVDDDLNEKSMGACVVTLPSVNGLKSGDFGVECNCSDEGSIRCVRQHIKVARERIRETLGHERFVELGFYDMGEEVARKWTEEEEDVFHEVVYSNPISLGKNFWEHLSLKFPARTKKELVSYYFNVFILRRRAAQNRSNVLDIDSDDDEWQGSYRAPFRPIGEDEESEEETHDQQVVQVSHEDDSSDDNDDDGDDDCNIDGADDDCNYNQRDTKENTMEKDDRRSNNFKAQIDMSLYDSRFDLVDHHTDQFSSSFQEDYDLQGDSCLSFECQTDMVDSCGPVGTEAAIQESGVKSDAKYRHGDSLGIMDGFSPAYTFEQCDAKAWDGRYLAGRVNDIDFLPTSNIIEEIFGPCT